MARGLNKVQLIGNLGADPEMRFTQQGTAVTSMRLAVSRSWKGQNGALQEETEWVRVSAWNKLAEVCNQYLTKGSRIYVEGRLKTSKYTDRDNIERYSTDVVMQEMIMLDGRREGTPVRDEDAAFDDEPETAPAPGAARRTPFAPRQPLASPRPGAPSRNQPQPVGSDDEIPF